MKTMFLPSYHGVVATDAYVMAVIYFLTHSILLGFEYSLSHDR